MKGIVKFFSADYDLINTSDGLGIHRFLMKKLCSELFKKMFIVLLASIVNASNHTKCVSLSNQKCEIQLTLIKLHPKELSQELHYYPFAVKLDKCVGSCNALNDLSNKVCAPNKTEDLNIHVFNIIAGKGESQISTKDISCESTCRFDGKKCNSDQWWNNAECQCECKKCHICEKDIWDPATCSFENGKCKAKYYGEFSN